MQGLLHLKKNEAVGINYEECEGDQISDYKQQLLKLMKKDALNIGDTVLSSGTKSNFYIDAKMVTLSPDGAYFTAKILFNMLKEENFDAIGGMTIGADPIVGAFAVISHLENKPIRTFIVRKEPKQHGKHKWIEGPIHNDDKIVVIDDVTTSGSSLLKAINIIKEQTNCEIIKTITLVDRLQNGKENLRKEGYDLVSIFNRDDLFRE